MQRRKILSAHARRDAWSPMLLTQFLAFLNVMVHLHSRATEWSSPIHLRRPSAEKSTNCCEPRARRRVLAKLKRVALGISSDRLSKVPLLSPAIFGKVAVGQRDTVMTHDFLVMLLRVVSAMLIGALIGLAKLPRAPRGLPDARTGLPRVSIAHA